MRASALGRLVWRDVRRSRGALATAGFGIVAGTGALVFFLGLGLAVRAVLLGDVFPIDRVELEPQAGADPGLLSLLLGGGKPPPGVTQASVDRLGAVEGVVAVYPKLRFAFPSGAFGGKEILGHEMGTHELLADGVDPRLVEGEATGAFKFVDPIEQASGACKVDEECSGGRYCELASGRAEGVCSEPVPVLVSPFLLELYNKGIAPAHQLPRVGPSLLERARGLTFRLQLGVSMMGRAKRGAPRSARARVVGISRSAIDLGVTLPLGVVRRWNTEFHGAESAERYSSVTVRVKTPGDVATVVTAAAGESLEPRDTRARDVSVLIHGVMALLGLVSAVILGVGASNIAFTFRVLVSERRQELALYRALGATRGDVAAWVVALSTLVGVLGGAGGVLVAWGASIGVDHLAATRLPEFPFKPATFFVFPAWLVGSGVAAGAAFALVGALSAVREAVRLDPSQALLER